MPKRFALAALGLLLVTAAWAQEAQKPEACPHPKGWKPTTDENLHWLMGRKRFLQKPTTDEKLVAWLLKHKNEDLCDIDLSGAELTNVELWEVKLNNANLSRATLNNADLPGAELANADLSDTKLANAHLGLAKLTNANLRAANLNGADLRDANLSGADLFGADLSGAQLFAANLSGAHLVNANLSGANLWGTNLSGADLGAANLSGAQLEIGASVAGALLVNANLTKAHYAPASAPPDPYVADIKGLSTVTFPAGQETGLVQLRDLLQKAGLRDLEREATFAIEHGETKHALDDWKKNPAGAVEGIFRYVAFDLTTRYGLRPSRALLLIAALWLLLIPIYAWPIWQAKRPPTAGSVYRIWPKDCVGVQEHKDTQERLHRRGSAAIGWAAYFSLLSAFQIGYREFSVGSWLSRAQPRNFTLEATGWVRSVSGIQSLLSVYLLAIWLLTYFGRPFQ